MKRTDNPCTCETKHLGSHYPDCLFLYPKQPPPGDVPMRALESVHQDALEREAMAEAEIVRLRDENTRLQRRVDEMALRLGADGYRIVREEATLEVYEDLARMSDAEIVAAVRRATERLGTTSPDE